MVWWGGESLLDEGEGRGGGEGWEVMCGGREREWEGREEKR